MLSLFPTDNGFAVSLTEDGHKVCSGDIFESPQQEKMLFTYTDFRSSKRKRAFIERTKDHEKLRQAIILILRRTKEDV